MYCYTFDFDIEMDRIEKINIEHKSKRNELGYIQGAVLENQNIVLTKYYY